MNYTIDKHLNAKGLLCPEPVMMLHKAVREMVVGEVIEVIATDPSTLRDIPKFCHFLGHELLQTREQEETYLFHIRKQ